MRSEEKIGSEENEDDDRDKLDDDTTDHDMGPRACVLSFIRLRRRDTSTCSLDDEGENIG